MTSEFIIAIGGTLVGAAILSLIAWKVTHANEPVSEPKKGTKGQIFCPECGGQQVVAGANGHTPRHETLIHFENSSIRCPENPQYIELCRFPIGPPPYHGRYSRMCMLPKGHIPSTACSLHSQPFAREDCPNCGKKFVLIQSLEVNPVGLGMRWVTPLIPTHTLPPTEKLVRDHWYRRRRKVTIPGELCLGAEQSSVTA